MYMGGGGGGGGVFFSVLLIYGFWGGGVHSLPISLTEVDQRDCSVQASIPKVVGSNPTVARHFFKLAWCGYTLRVTPQISYMFSKFTFSCPENYLNSPENLLQIYLNLPESALEIYLKFLMSNYQGCCTSPPPQ